MANGAAVSLRLVTETSELAPQAPGEPIEHRVGIAMADAMAAVSAGCLEFWAAGKLTPATKMAGTEHFVNLYKLAQAAPVGIDFAAIARSEGFRVLQERHGMDLPKATVDMLIDGTLEILAGVTAAMAH